MKRPIIDAHLDLSWCALSFDRDLTQPLDVIRETEKGMCDSPARGHATLCLPEMRKANMAICLGTLLARTHARLGASDDGSGVSVTHGASLSEGPRRITLDYRTQSIAHSIAQGQLAYYRLLEQQGHIRFIRTQTELKRHWYAWQNGMPGGDEPLGLILAMEGADPITHPDEAHLWWQQGLRVVGPVHYGRSVYAVGTSQDGPLTDAGRELLKVFEQLGMVVDVTHLSDQSLFETLDRFSGRVLASHHNCRSLVPRDRQLNDEQILLLIERDAVIGSALDAWMLHPDWKLGESSPELVSIEAVADHVDHICQLAGNTRHVAIGSDLDGGFGYEQAPHDLKTIDDLHKLETIFSERGYSDSDIDGIFYGNWLRFFGETLSA